MTHFGFTNVRESDKESMGMLVSVLGDSIPSWVVRRRRS